MSESMILGVHEDSLYGWAFGHYRIDHGMESLNDTDMIAQIQSFTDHIAHILYERYDLAIQEGGEFIDLG